MADIFIDLKLEGAKELNRQLKQLPDKLRKRLIRKSMKASLKPVLADAKRRVPKDSGDLRASLEIKPGTTRKGVIREQVQTKRGFFQGGTFYGGFVEFGFKKVKAVRLPSGQLVSIKNSAVTPIPARPFLRPALKENEEKVIKIFIREVRNLLSKEARK